MKKPNTFSEINENPQNTSSVFTKIGFSFLGIVEPAVLFYLAGLLIFFAFRLCLCLWHFSRVRAVENFWLVFPIGLRMDTILLCYLLLLPCLVLLLLPVRFIKKAGFGFCLFFSLLAALFVFFEVATFPFMAEFDSRPDRLFIEHMFQAREVLGMVWKGYFAELMAALLLSALTGLMTFRLLRSVFKRLGPCPLKKRALLFIAVMPLLALGARSSLGHRPANISTAAFSRSHLVNQLGLNSTYSLVYAWVNMKKHELEPDRIYGKMGADEMLNRVRSTAMIPGQEGSDPSSPLLHRQESRFARPRPLNLVIILEESLGAEYVGCLGGLPITPQIDRLSGQGLLFTRLFATGTRTVRGIEAVISGFLPTPGKSVVKLGLSQQGFYTMADLLGRKGYITEFIYGGDSQFDNMRAFFLGNGFQNIVDLPAFENPVFRGTWGVSDEDLFAKANAVFKSHGDRPFFALVLSTSNHDPFEFPEGRFELYEQPRMTRHNAMKYADYAVGAFFDAAQKEAYYKNTLFLIIADHSTRLRGKDLIPLKKYHIPGLLIGPGVAPGVYDRLASQIDMGPTLLDVMGLDVAHPSTGRPLLSFPQSVPGRAVMQYGTTHAFWRGDRMIIQRPQMKPEQFRVEGFDLVPDALDPGLARDALAHALLPGYLYKKRLYRLPPE